MDSHQTMPATNKRIDPCSSLVCQSRPTMQERLWTCIYVGISTAAILYATVVFIEGIHRGDLPAFAASVRPVSGLTLKAELAKRDAEIERLRAELRAIAASREVENTKER